jgi:NAD(P)-dependent dehydrogenase (short-subunit alcohol dehydrogenase family)
MEFAPFDITVNTVCPGIVMTPLHDGLVEDTACPSIKPKTISSAGSR